MASETHAASCTQCRSETPRGDEDLLKWRSSAAPLLLRFPNKRRGAAAACSREITHNGRATANISRPRTNTDDSVTQHRARNQLLKPAFNFICLLSSISLTDSVSWRRIDVKSLIDSLSARRPPSLWHQKVRTAAQ